MLHKCQFFFWRSTKCFALIGYSSCDISTHLFRFYLWPIVLSDIFFRGFLLKLQRCNHVKNNYMYHTQSPLNYRLHLIMLKQTPLQEPQFNSCFIFHVLHTYNSYRCVFVLILISSNLKKNNFCSSCRCYSIKKQTNLQESKISPFVHYISKLSWIGF